MNRRQAHDWVEKERGKASGYPCVGDRGACPRQAVEWSCEVEQVAPENLVLEWSGRYVLPHSLSLDDYSPRCLPCHRTKDRRRTREERREERILQMSDDEWFDYVAGREAGLETTMSLAFADYGERRAEREVLRREDAERRALALAEEHIYDPLPYPEAWPHDLRMYEGTGIGALYGLPGSERFLSELGDWRLVPRSSRGGSLHHSASRAFPARA